MPIFEASIDANIPDVVRKLDGVARRQLPFAGALALTWTARDAAADLRLELDRVFTLRNTFLERGIRFSKASKRDRRPTAKVFSVDELLVLHVTGGVKRPRGKTIALPRAAKRAKSGVLRKNQRPRAVLRKPNAFVGRLDDGASGIFQRRGRGKASRAVLLFRLHPRSVRIAPRFRFGQVVDRTVARSLQRNFGRALSKAIASSR